MTAKILIVEDEPAIRELLALNLRHAGFEPVHAPDAAAARREIDAALPDLVLLDWMLPDMPGVEVARRLRADSRTRHLPVIMLTARSAESDKLGGFDAGADDYVTKPFSPRELVARVRALLRRRAPEASDEPIEVAGLRLEPQTFRVIAEGQSLRMGPTEFRLLHYLMRNLDRVLSRAKLLDGVWGDHVFIEERTVDVHIRRLRLALQPTGHDRLVETVRGGGYRFLPQ
ncbi:MAG: phosphate regulon transcriptional regulatory protein PhoB [Burkholderiales bacterium]|nr:MAG: phosphate regulon transcriptional regulatory protein PhoB [Burkholderiales bacterium]